MRTISVFHRRVFNFLLCLGLALAIGGPLSGVPQGVQAAAITFNVDTTTDAHDNNLSDGICNNGIDGCSLRAAIEQAFSVSGAGNPVTIHFGSSAGVLYNLSLGPINWVASYVTVDGESLGVTISGSGLTSGQSAFRISGNNNTLRNVTVRNAPQDGVQVGDFSGTGAGNNNLIHNVTLIGNGASGVFVYGSVEGGDNNRIQSCVIGANVSSTSCGAGEGNGADGIHIDAGAVNTEVSGNRLVCNSVYGLYIHGSGGSADHTLITWNAVGLGAAAQDSDMGNLYGGILIEQDSHATLQHNVISGNNYNGIWLSGASYVTMTANYIGTNGAGSAAIPNDHCGIVISNSAHDNFVGGYNSANDRNVISGNSGSGVCIESNASGNRIESNFIGLNSAGTAAIPNQLAGVAIIDGTGNHIGSSMAGVRQFISGNIREGVYIEGGSDNFVGQTNSIGLSASDGMLGNGREGVMLNNTTNNAILVGTIAYNGLAGIAAIGNSGVGNLFGPERVYGNRGLPIDLNNDGPTSNGSHMPPGPNNWLNYPIITGGSGTTINGTACTSCTVLIYRAINNPAGNGGGGEWLMRVDADASGIWSATLPAGMRRSDVSLIACEAPCSSIGNTSEMSPRYQVLLPAVLRNQ